METLGSQLTTYAVAGGQVQLFDGGLAITTPTGVVEVRFAFPKLGRPHFPAGGGSSVRILDAAAVRATVRGSVLDAGDLVRAALAGRVALVASGNPGDVVPVQVGAVEQVDAGADLGFPLLAAMPERRLYDVAVDAGGGRWRVVAPHALYYRSRWTDLGIAHITDTHVARRIDAFRPTLRALGRPEAAARMVSWNDRFRGFVRFANALHDAGELDVIVATGDLIDYQFEVGDDPVGPGNARFLRQLILGAAPGPDFPAVEELRVPILMTPGNHDYRHNPYQLVFDAELAGVDIHRFRNFAGYHLLESDAAALTNALYFPGKDGVPGLSPADAEAMVAVEPSLRAFREQLADPESFVVSLGPHRIVMLDSSHDVGMVTSLTDALRTWLGTLDEDEATFVGGSPNCEGVSDAELELAVSTLDAAPDDGLVLLGLHAPLVNLWSTEYPYYLRETQRADQADQAWWYVARQSGPLPSLDQDFVRGRHREWFGRDGEAEPSYLKRGDSQDLLDFGVSRGRTDDLLRALADDGTRRRADVVLAGHTHYHNEVSLRPLGEGGLAFYLDFYTQNPRQYYPARHVTPGDARESAASGSGQPGTTRYRVSSSTAYVHVDEEAIGHGQPWPMPYDAYYDNVIQVPPYADPLDTASDKAAWWERHKPLLLQTGALGPMESHQVSFSGFRLLSVRDNVIDKVHFVSIERLEANGFAMPLAAAAAVDPPPAHRHVERSRRFRSPAAASRPCVAVPGAPATHSVIYRDGDGYLNELWDVPGSVGAGRLADRSVTPAAVGELMAYLDPLGMTVVVYRADDDHIHSLYWNGPAAAGHDALSKSAGAVQAAGNPVAYALAGMNHVFYRSADGHIEELYWSGTDAVGHGHITGYCGEPLAAGDPSAFGASPANVNVVVYRGVDGHIHSLYWSDGPTGHDNLSGYVGSPLAAGEPVATYIPALDASQVVYRGEDNHLHEIWWVGVAPAQVWDLTAAAGAPTPVADPGVCYVPESNTKHVVYVGADGHLHELAWTPGAGAPTWTDLTLLALAPPAAAEQPTMFTVPGTPTRRVLCRGTDGHIHEIRWG